MDAEQPAVAGQSGENPLVMATLADSEPPSLVQPPVQWRELLVCLERWQQVPTLDRG